MKINLLEAHQGNLYHWVQLKYLRDIIDKNFLPAEWKHYIPYSNTELVGRSFSRNPRFDFAPHERLLLVFDYNKLSENNRILPVDADRALIHGFMNIKKNKGISTSDPKDIEFFNPPKREPPAYGSRDTQEDYQEEFVINDINRISAKLNYVVQAIPTNEFDFLFEEDIEDFRIWCIANKIKYNNLGKSGLASTKDLAKHHRRSSKI